MLVEKNACLRRACPGFEVPASGQGRLPGRLKTFWGAIQNKVYIEHWVMEGKMLRRSIKNSATAQRLAGHDPTYLPPAEHEILNTPFSRQGDFAVKEIEAR